MNPYETLGVKPNASAAQVKRAFRKKSLATHPDRGGTAEAFQQVKLAYTVLGDPEKRARYDRTGQIDDGKPDNARGDALRLLGECFLQALAGQLQSGNTPSGIDLIPAIRKALEAKRKETDKPKQEALKAQKCMTEVRKRLTVKDGENELGMMIDGQLRNMEAALEQISQQEKRVQTALDELERYCYSFDAREWRQPYVRSGLTFMNTTATTGFVQ